MKHVRTLALAGTALALALAGCAAPTTDGGADGGSEPAEETTTGDAAQAGGDVTVTLYGDPWAAAVQAGAVAAFEEETGGAVEVALGDNATWFAQLRASQGGDAPFDVMILLPEQQIQAVEEGLVEPIDTSRLSNWDDVAPSLAEAFEQDGEQYGVPFSAGGLGIAYRKDLVETPPTAWSDMWDPEYAGHVAALPLTFQAGAQWFAGLVHEEGGTLDDPAAVDAAFGRLEELAPAVSVTPNNAVGVQTALQQGSAWLAPWWDGRAAALAQEDPNIAFAYPKSGATAAVTTFYVPANAPDKDASYAFLDSLLDPGAQAEFAEAMWYPTSNVTTEFPAAFEGAVSADLETFDSYVFVDYATLTPNLTDWQNRWNEIFGG